MPFAQLFQNKSLVESNVPDKRPIRIPPQKPSQMNSPHSRRHRQFPVDPTRKSVDNQLRGPEFAHRVLKRPSEQMMRPKNP